MRIDKVERLSLLRHIYCALINNGRTYSAFNRKEVLPLIDKLAGRGTIFDPMSGYGSTMYFCAQKGIKSFCVEANPPEYLWNCLFHPQRAKLIISFIERVLASRKFWPHTRLLATASSTWFPQVSKNIIAEVFDILLKQLTKLKVPNYIKGEVALSLLIPFVGRFSTTSPGNIVTHVKEGGICVYKGWEDDFYLYLGLIKKKIEDNLNKNKEINHTLILGDSCTLDFPTQPFSAFITSPPYPNGRDYSAMFAPENDILHWFDKEGVVKGYSLKTKLLGSVSVSNHITDTNIRSTHIKSLEARAFIEKLRSYKGTKQAEYDNRVYYIPYFENYFLGIEAFIENISRVLMAPFLGFIIVIDNTARKYTVPVSSCIVETWQRINYDARIVPELSREKAPFGAINPRMKGWRARQTEHIIQVRKGN